MTARKLCTVVAEGTRSDSDAGRTRMTDTRTLTPEDKIDAAALARRRPPESMDDLPEDIQRELLRSATACTVNLYYLADIYRAGRRDGGIDLRARLAEVERERDDAREKINELTRPMTDQEFYFRGPDGWLDEIKDLESALAQMREERAVAEQQFLARIDYLIEQRDGKDGWKDVANGEKYRADQAEARLMQVRDVETWVQGEIADANQHLQEYELGSSAPGAQQTRGELRMLRRFAIKLSTALAAEAPPRQEESNAAEVRRVVLPVARHG